MATTPTQGNEEIVLYDLASTAGVCFSPIVWRVRLVLNYKAIPYRTVWLGFAEIARELEKLGIPPHDPATSKHAYTVPAIQHVASGRYIMDSMPVLRFLNETYPLPAVDLETPVQFKIERKARQAAGMAVQRSIVPREIAILAPVDAEYFRRTREAVLGCRLEELLDGEREEREWEAAEGRMREVSALLRGGEGPFVLGERLGYIDLFVVGALQSARVVHERTWERQVRFDGFREVYEACAKLLERKD